MGRAFVNGVLAGVGSVVVLAAALGLGPTPARAEARAPWWAIASGSEPTSLALGEEGEIVVTAQNRGDAPTSGEVTITDRLPAGLRATGIRAVAGERIVEGEDGRRGHVTCTPKLTCVFGAGETTNSEGEPVPEELRPYEEIEMVISVVVRPEASSGEENVASVSGGGAAHPAGAEHAIEVGGGSRFGFEDFQLTPENSDGSVDTQAGSHPFQLTSVVTLNTAAPGADGGPRTAGLARSIVSELPPGLVADPAPLARCGDAQFEGRSSEAVAAGYIANACPASSAVGVATLTFNEPSVAGLTTVTTPIFDLEPRPGEPARFGIDVLGVISTFLQTGLRSGGDYGVTLAVRNLPEIAWFLSLKLTFWGVPGDPRHDGQRGWECLEGFGSCPASTETSTPPFLTLPTSCGAPFEGTVGGNSWGSSARAEEQAEPLAYRLHGGSGESLSLDGCNQLPFAPEVTVAPERSAASAPAGLSVDVHVPQTTTLPAEGSEPGAGEPAGSSIRNMTIALPEGVRLNPSGADGLQACTGDPAALEPGRMGSPGDQIGFEGFQTPSGSRAAVFTAKLPEPLEQGVSFCPNASKLGTVRIATPLLAGPLEGAMYLASPQNFKDGQRENPFGSLVAVYVVAEEPVSGVLVKLPGAISLDQKTGRLTARFEEMPQLPFEDVDLRFFGGPRAPLSTPARCGAYMTTATFEPWSAELPDVAAATVEASATFHITTGPGAGPGASPSSPCPGGSAALGFAPSVSAGTAGIDAGAFSPLTVSIGREDGQQAIESVKLKLPPGLSAAIAGVAPCGEARANAGTCGAESEIGETTISAGLGPDPLTISGGKVYLTGPYDGAPFGLAIVAPARVGPFVLQEGRPIVIRAKLEIDFQTAALTIATGPGAIPSIVEGFPLQIKHLNITIGGTGPRSSFTLDPTSCAPMSIEGVVGGSEGALATAKIPFQMANCTSLPFKPKLMAITKANGEFQGHGASLHIAIAAPPGGSNLRSLKLDLPQRLPARLATVQQACPESVFDSDRAACPKASVVGSASVATPILGVPMSGPAYLVAKGSASGARARASGPEAAFPDLVLALRGGGVKIDLTGGLYVNEKNVTSATFRSLPDVPIRRLDLVLPEGPRSILAASSALCTKKPLKMRTSISGQNGARVKPAVRVGVEGCGKAKKGKRGKRARHGARRRHGKRARR